MTCLRRAEHEVKAFGWAIAFLLLAASLLPQVSVAGCGVFQSIRQMLARRAHDAESFLLQTAEDDIPAAVFSGDPSSLEISIPFPKNAPREFVRSQDLSKLFSAWGVEHENAGFKKLHQMAEAGYVLRRFSAKGGRLVFEFDKAPELITTSERQPEPAYVAAQRSELRRFFGNEKLVYRSQFGEKAFEPQGRILSERNAASALRIAAKFVLVRGENFLRVGLDHPHLAGFQEIHAAGEVSFEFDRTSREVIEAELVPKSGNYWPKAESLVQAVEALWRQGIYPRVIKLYGERDLGKIGPPILTLKAE